MPDAANRSEEAGLAGGGAYLIHPNCQIEIRPSLALGVTLGLIEAVTGREAFFLGLDESESDGLGIDVDLDAKNVIDPSS